jgi:hypothetical protein
MIGGTVVLIGVAMILLPGPALIVIPAGLAILGLEFAFARRWLRRLRATGEQVVSHTFRRLPWFKSSSRSRAASRGKSDPMRYTCATPAFARRELACARSEEMDARANRRTPYHQAP